jgi:hypothetical protein
MKKTPFQRGQVEEHQSPYLIPQCTQQILHRFTIVLPELPKVLNEYLIQTGMPVTPNDIGGPQF